MAADPHISARALGKKLGVSHEKANQLKREWQESHPPAVASTSGKEEVYRGKSKTLSKTEVEELYEPFIEALESDFEAIDKWLWMRQKAVGIDTGETPIWSDFDEQEAAALTRIMFRWGQKNEIVAMGVRGIVDSGDYIKVGTMMAPRFKRTVEIYRETKKPRESRRGRVHADQVE